MFHLQFVVAMAQKMPVLSLFRIESLKRLIERIGFISTVTRSAFLVTPGPLRPC